MITIGNYLMLDVGAAPVLQHLAVGLEANWMKEMREKGCASEIRGYLVYNEV
jgi:hypothetical protein